MTSSSITPLRCDRCGRRVDDREVSAADGRGKIVAGLAPPRVRVRAPRRGDDLGACVAEPAARWRAPAPADDAT